MKRLEEINRQNNMLISCIWCKKEFKFGDRQEIIECPCIDRNTGATIGVVKWVAVGACSNDCRVRYEKDCCIKNGHRYDE